METKKILSWISLLLGEVLIIIGFILFGEHLGRNTLILNIIIASIIYSLFFSDILFSWINLGDKSQRKIGTIGVRWIFTWLYTLFAIATMVVCNLLLNLSFPIQLFVHGILIFLLLLGFIAVISVSNKTKEVFTQENTNRNGVIEMKKAITNLKNRMNDLSGLPEYFSNKIDTLEDDIRYLSPSNNLEAHELESSFTNTIRDIYIAIENFSMNEELINNNLKKCERIFQNRKQIHSN